MFFIEKILFTEIECLKIIEDIEKTDYYHWNRVDRNYHSNQIKLNQNNTWIFNRLIDFFNEETNNQILTVKDEIHFHKFKIGDYFKKHNDTRDKRMFSIGVLLNSDFNGGDFNLFIDKKITVKKETGNTYIFDVGIEHEVSEIFDGVRYSLIWFLQQEHIKILKDKLI